MRRVLLVTTATVSLGAGAALNCARTPGAGAVADQAGAPGAVELTRLVPDQGNIANGDIVIVRAIGRGFHATDNVVEFGPVELTRVRSSVGGDTLIFTVPLEVPSSGGAPPRRLDPGDYEVAVRVGALRTQALRFRVTGEPEGRP